MPRPVLKRGDKGTDVLVLQKMLNKHGALLRADGDFGRNTERAVEEFCDDKGLEWGSVSSRVWDELEKDPPKTGMEPDVLIHVGSAKLQRAWNNYGGLLNILLSLQGFSPAAATAVLMAESGGAGMVNGRMKIRFENHVFKRRLDNNDLFFRHFKYRTDKRWKGHYWREFEEYGWNRFHGEQDAEWEVLEFARTLNEEAALQSISMGAPQMMGFNHKRVGHGSAKSMFEDWCLGEEQQIRGMFVFIEGDLAMVKALQDEDWVWFAERYNGLGRAEDYGESIGRYVAQARAVGIV